MIPLTEQDTWKMYPEYRWTHHTSSLLTLQKIKWSLFNTGYGAVTDVNINTVHKIKRTVEPFMDNYIFLMEPHAIGRTRAHFCIHRGLIVHTDLPADQGTLELKMQGILLSGNFRKFSGIIYIEAHGNDIFTLKLRPTEGFYAKHEAQVDHFYQKHVWLP